MSWLKEQAVLLKRFLAGAFCRTLSLCALGMLLAVLLGVGTGLLLPEESAQVINFFMEQVEESGAINEQGEMSVFSLLMNNWRAMLVSAVYGLIPFLFLPLLSLLYNGLLLGILAVLLQSRGVSILTYLAGILPHGIFELPALVLSVACGVVLCRNMCRMVTGSPRKVPFMALAEDLLRVLVLVIAPLTVAAAFVECYVTPVVMAFFL
ncbi:MAG: stage II sporulation protein M [Oscillibacter sp.]|nr:stage II sporulation protein M [Oscillibacter sp.]